MDFASMKKNRKKSLENAKSTADSYGTKSYGDENFWKAEIDKSGNGYALIKFLPAPAIDNPTENDVGWVKRFNHGFNDVGGWLIDNCPTTHEGKCPVCEANSLLWNSGMESNKDIARKRKRRLSYIANIYIVDDKSNPANNGKVFLFKFGTKIFDKIKDMLTADFEDDVTVDPTDLWGSEQFKLKIRKVDGFTNYDKSEFVTAKPIGNEDELEKIWKSEYSLKAEIADDKFKSYEQLQVRLNTVLNLSPTNIPQYVGDNDTEMGKVPDDVGNGTAMDTSSTTTDLDYFQNLADQ